MNKIYINIILLLFVFSIGNIKNSNAGFFESLINTQTGLQEIKLNFIELQNPNLKTIKYQRQFNILKSINPKIKYAILEQYKNGRFWYYQTLWIIKNYNNFLYFSNKYFSSLRNREIFWNTKETKRNIHNNFRDMKHSYLKVTNLAKQKNMN